MKYPLLDIVPFGRQLIETGDLDPIYVAVAGAGMPAAQMKRWALAYWCCYHAGASSWLSEREDAKFWDAMEVMARNTEKPPVDGRWPRGRERRHFRGNAAISSVKWLRAHFILPEQAVDSLAPEPVTFSVLKERISQWPGFGSWIAFKAGDMVERLLGGQVRFESAADFSDAPIEGASLWYREQHGSWPADPIVTAGQVSEMLMEAFIELAAPPDRVRPIGLQECETVLCKWKSHKSGGYYVGLDTEEIKHGTGPWTVVSPTAAAIVAALPGIAPISPRVQQHSLF